MKIGYIRVSTVEQNEERQIEAMKDLQIEKFFKEKMSGKDTKRPILQQMLDFAREGDTIYVESFSRLARNTVDLLNMIEFFKKKNINLVSLKEKLDLDTPAGKLLVSVIAAISTFERDCLLDRQREGIALAKAKGKYKGKKAIKMPGNWEEVYLQWKSRKITATEAMQLLGLKRNTFYRMLKRYEENGK